MKQLLLVLLLSCFAFSQEEQVQKIIKKGETYKADQDYRLMTTTDLLKINEKLIDLKTLKLKETEYKNIIKNDSLQYQLVEENKKMYKEMFDNYRKLWLESQEEISKKTYIKWYENKFLWFTLGIATTVISSEVVANVK